MTGLSQVNFDVQGLGDDEEAQLDKEDAERERELHELLSNELPDDLLDDDNISFTSPGHSTSTQGHETPEFHTDQSHNQQHLADTQYTEGQRGSQHKQSVYPKTNKISVLLTQRGEEFIQRFGTSPPNDAHNPEPSETHVNPLSESMPQGYHQSSYGYIEDQGGFGEDSDEHQAQYIYHGGDDLESGDSDYGGDYGHSGYSHTEQYHGTNTVHDENLNVVYSKPGALPNIQQMSEDSDMIDNFKVQYKCGGDESQHDTIQVSQEMIGQTTVSRSTVELAQLQILHRARKRKLEELTNELARKEKDYERQIRVLNHQLALMKGERDGMAASLAHAQEVATNHKNSIDELQCKYKNLDFEKERLNNERNEIECELESAKKTIESLHQQLMQLEKSESLSRAREQHENVTMVMKKRHEDDLTRLKHKLDDVNNSLMWKDEESKRLHDELLHARKEADRVRLDRAETVNRLTKSLEQSQKQNEELLNSGSTQEISQLQRELSLIQHQKENIEKRYQALETDLVDLKEQLRIYESMSKLTIKDDDRVKRNLEADEWKTPGAPLQSKFSTEEALVGLQKELQYSLTSNRTKREEIQQLRGQFEEVQKQLATKENEIERLEILVRKQEMRVLEQEKKISELEELNRIPENQETHREEELHKLQILVKEQGSKLEHSRKREQEMEKLNLQLKSQMSEMVRDHDADKQSSVEQCRQSCLEFHDQALTTMKEQLISEYDEQLAKLRLDLKTVTEELDQVKESYVVLSEESRWIEKQTRERCEEETSERMTEAKAKWDESKSCELLELRQTLATEMERTLEKEKSTWRKTEEERLKNKVETELALAKMDWNKEQQKLRKEAIEIAVNMAEKEWQAKYGKTKNDDALKSQELEQSLEELRTQMVKEQEEKMNTARQEWERLKVIEIERENEKSRRTWEDELTKIVEQAEKIAVEKAKDEWLKKQEDENKISEARDLAEAVSAAKQEWEREKELQIINTLTCEKRKWQASADDEKQQAINTAVSLAEEKWNNEHINKVNNAVKEALDLAEATWRKEKDSAVESAVTRSLHSAKETWNENKIKEIEQILSNARKQWFTELNYNKQETSPRSRKSLGSSEDVNKTFSYLEAQYSKNLKEFRETELKRVLEEHEKAVLDTREELETKYERKLREQEDKHQTEFENITRKSQEDRDAELKDLETEYQSKLENIVEEIEEKWREKKAALEEDWTVKFEKQQETMHTSYREKYQSERESLGRQMREKYEKGVEHARKKLEYQFKEKLQVALERAKHDWEAEQEEDRLAVEEQHLKRMENERERLRNEMQQENKQRISQVENESLLKTKQLEDQLKNEKNRYKMDIENLQKELGDIKERRSQMKKNDIEQERKHVTDVLCKASQTDLNQDQPWISLAEISEETPNYERLNELRRQYLATTAQLKEDLMQHANETRNNAAKAIRTEVMKERHSTANQLRKYYLECLKQILDEDKEAFKNNQPTRSNKEKLKIMEERLRLPEGKNETTKSYDSTLTNVTELRDTSYQTNDENAIISSATHPDKESLKKPREYRYNDVIKTSSRPPRGATEWTKRQNEDEVKCSRDQKHGDSRRQDRKDFCAEVDTQELSSSTESLYSILSPQMDLPPVIELLGLSNSDVLEPDRGVQSNSSSSSGTYYKQDVPGKRHRTERESTHSNKHNTHSNQQDTSQNIWDTNLNQRETQSHKRDSNSKPRDMNLKERALRSNEKHSGKRNLHGNIRDTRQQDSQNSAQSTSTMVFSNPVIKSGNSLKMTSSSLRRPVGDVLPSKPLSPASHSPGKFSYTLHSRKTNK